MATLTKKLPILLYFYQGELKQEDADKVVEHFSDKEVHLRKVHDINDTRDLVERCAYASGAVPLIYFVRKAEGVITDGVLADPLKRPNAAKPTAKGEDTEVVQASEPVLSSGHVAPTDAKVAADLLKEEIEQVTAEKSAPTIKPADVTVDNQAAPVSTVTGQLITEDGKVNQVEKKAPVAAPKPVTAPAADTTKTK